MSPDGSSSSQVSHTSAPLLAQAVRREGSSALFGIDNGAEIVDVGERRPGVARLEEAVAVVVARRSLGRHRLRRVPCCIPGGQAFWIAHEGSSASRSRSSATPRLQQQIRLRLIENHEQLGGSRAIVTARSTDSSSTRPRASRRPGDHNLCSMATRRRAPAIRRPFPPTTGIARERRLAAGACRRAAARSACRGRDAPRRTRALHRRFGNRCSGTMPLIDHARLPGRLIAEYSVEGCCATSCRPRSRATRSRARRATRSLAST